MTRLDDVAAGDRDNTEQVHARQTEGAYALIEQLRDRRIRLGLRQRDVASRMGRDPSVVSNLERLGSDPRWSSLRRYASALGVVIDYEITPYEEFAIRGQMHAPDDAPDVDPRLAVPAILGVR
ncbi:helix-turn-helix transcriptional regulator [Isoptericola sp. AK164]|uniref:helix-turn-helix domain-containing protein n=1 Tax=Isoptericola sp. AK164 TaxID=3024246 RepID=UPI0024182800|nr:helix-turn-helix transcriptional regulator [Isoptericola sp. AK164]